MSLFSWRIHLELKLMELCSLLVYVVDKNMHLVHKFFAVQESSCVQYLEMRFITNARNGTINISVILKLLKCESVCDVN